VPEIKKLLVEIRVQGEAEARERDGGLGSCLKNLHSLLTI
jgi:hypothetical protein